MTDRFLRFALAYAHAGLHVFPLLPKSKEPDGALVFHGVKQASVDAERIRAWWRRSPDAGIGIAIGMGLLVGARVLDVNLKHGGDEVLARLVEEHGSLPSTKVQRSGSGGQHILLRWPTGDWKTKLIHPTSGLELLGAGRYFVAAPSIHPDTGRQYEWTTAREVDIAPAPAWLIELARRDEVIKSASADTPRVSAPRYAKGALASAMASIERAPSGDRNNELNRQAFGLARFVRSGVLDASLVRRALADAARASGLLRSEVEKTINSALRARETRA